MTATASVAPTSEDSPFGASAVRINLRPLANPKPMGFMALAIATLMLSALQLGWLPAGESSNVALILITFSFPLQLLGAVFGFLARDVVVGTGMAMLSGTWLATAVVSLNLPPGAQTTPTLGILLLAVALGLLVPAAGAATGKLLAAAILGGSAARFAVTAVYELTGMPMWGTVAGVVGVLLCVLALYGALALLFEDIRKQTVIPVLRRGAGRVSMNGNLKDQLRSIEREGGIREQL